MYREREEILIISYVSPAAEFVTPMKPGEKRLIEKCVAAWRLHRQKFCWRCARRHYRRPSMRVARIGGGIALAENVCQQGKNARQRRACRIGAQRRWPELNDGCIGLCWKSPYHGVGCHRRPGRRGRVVAYIFGRILRHQCAGINSLFLSQKASMAIASNILLTHVLLRKSAGIRGRIIGGIWWRY